MSTERRIWHTWTGIGSRFVADALESELMGIHPRRTRLTLVSLTALVGLILASYASTVVWVGGAPLETYSWGFDTLSAVVILAATVVLTVAPLVYAVWNGGPVLSFAMPLVPIAVAEALAGRYVLGLDAAIALTVGTAGAALALYSADVHETGSLRPWRTREFAAYEDRLLFVTVVSTVAIVTIGSFLTTVPSYMQARYAPFGILWIVPLVVGGAYWGTWLRTVFETGRDRRSVTRDS